MKLIIQIPCWNEESSIAKTLSCLPRMVEGFDCVEFLVIDDGSTDRTIEVAKAGGADHVERLGVHKGLATCFSRGLRASLRLGADVIVNTDADNQYNADDIVKLVTPIAQGAADLVVGARPIGDIGDFSPLKKLLQKVGSAVVRQLSGTSVPDAPSGFRAMTRECAMRLNVFSPFSYTLETLIQAGRKGMTVVSVPVRVNPVTRPSRLVRGNFDYVRRSLWTMLRVYAVYRPFRFFSTLATVPFFAGFLISVRFVYYWSLGEGTGRIQSLILSALLMGMGFILYCVAFLSDMIAVNRQILEDLQVDSRRSRAAFDETSDGNL